MIVLFDGVCNLCAKSVQFIIKRDPEKIFKFASLQSDHAQKILASVVSDKKNLSTLVLVDKNQKIYFESSAWLRILKELSGLWSLFFVLIVVPPFFRDFIYRFIAKNRYHWFGKKEECWLPTKEWQDRFLP